MFKDGLFKNTNAWVDGQSRMFIPGEFYNLGGKTKWYGAALLRFARHEFEADEDHQCLAWPFGYDVLAPYYDEAESLLNVNSFDNEPELQKLLNRISTADPAWKPEPLPLGLKREILGNEAEAKHFDGFASACGYKSDAEWNLLDPIADAPTLIVETGKSVVGLTAAGGDAAAITGVTCADGSAYAGRAVVLAAGAMTSPRILQDHLNDSGLADSLPCAPLVGANFKLHINSAILGFSPFTNQDVLRKTAIIFNDEFPHSTIQCLGWIDGDILGAQLPAAVPKFVARAAGHGRSGSSPPQRTGPIPTTGSFRVAEPVLRSWITASIGSSRRRRSTASSSAPSPGASCAPGWPASTNIWGWPARLMPWGTMVTGTDDRTSVVDPHGKVHGMENLYVADGSFLPRSSRVNPALSIYAWGLRLGDHLAQTLPA